jgi:ABC-type transporter Mla subunit MlaD
VRRIALILFSLVAIPAALVASATGADKATYQVELDNAFGLVKGSEVRVGGVQGDGVITELDVNEEKKALVTIEVGTQFGAFKADASCSSEPQSLIAEYFLDCQPGTADQPLEGPIPAAQNQTTVQNDLVQNTLREPFKRRLQLIINEFGTALVGNAENLNAAIRSGAPALRELGAVLKILGRQNTIIAQLNADSDAIFEQLTARREQVVDFIDEAEDTARVSADRREDLSRDFDLLDDFLFELQPVMVELGNLAREQTPLLTDLHAAAPGLNKLAKNLPAFNDGTRVSLKSLGGASEVGARALTKSTDEIAALNDTAQRAFPAAGQVAQFLESIDDPANAVEEDCDARYDLREQPGEADRRVGILEQKLGVNLTGAHNIGPTPAIGDLGCDLDPGSPPGNPGYTGLEGLLNYAYVQPAALNLFDPAGHALQLNIVGAADASEAGGACGHVTNDNQWPTAELFNTDPGPADDHTRDPRKAAHCVGVLGDYQPGVSEGTVDDATGLTDFTPGAPGGELRKYDSSVCPDGSTWLSLCDPSSPNPYAGFQAAPQPQQTQPGAQAPTQPGVAPEEISPKKLREILGLPPDAPLPKPPKVPGVPSVPNLPQIPVLPSLPQLPGLPPLGGGSAPNSTGSNLLGFLLGP